MEKQSYDRTQESICNATNQARQAQFNIYLRYVDGVKSVSAGLMAYGTDFESACEFMSVYEKGTGSEYIIITKGEGGKISAILSDERIIDFSDVAQIARIYDLDDEFGVSKPFVNPINETKSVAFYNVLKDDIYLIEIVNFQEISTYDLIVAGKSSFSCITDIDGNILLNSKDSNIQSYTNFYTYWIEQGNSLYKTDALKNSVLEIVEQKNMDANNHVTLVNKSGDKIHISYRIFNDTGDWQCYFTVVNLSEIMDIKMPMIPVVLLYLSIILVFTGNIVIILHQNKILWSENKRAESASKAKGDFLSKMSHEIRTPLNVIIGMMDIAYESTDNPEETKYCIEKSQLASKHLLMVINNILDMSKIESNKVSLNNRDFQINSMINVIKAIYENECARLGLVYVQNAVNTEKLFVCADELRIKQVIINILSNAVKYTHRGGTITFSTVAREADDGFVDMSFCVEDTGIGIAPENKQRIFEAFEQGDLNESIVMSGTGLGLAISNSIAHMMNGSIELESELGVGSKFTFVVKLQKAKTTCFSEDSDIDYTEKIPDLTGKRILIVEDNEMNAEILTKLLAKTNVSVELAYNGKIALDMFSSSAENYYNMIFMDVLMPVMGGYECTQKIRSLKRSDAQNVFICALTASAFSEDVHKALDSGMNYHITKPIDAYKLYKTLYKLL